MNCFFIKYGNNEIQAGQAIQYIGGFHSILLQYIGQHLMVNFMHIAALCHMEASKFREIVYTFYQTQGQYI